jgi:dihydrofolate synthase/folylpolyglutamate synthase
MNFTKYDEAINYLYSKAPMFSMVGKSAYKANLNNTLTLDKYFNYPHKKFPSIHIAGTNGKGSVSHTLAAILMDAGYKTGLYTSPHIKDFRERIKINGLKIDESYILNFLNESKNIIENIQPSFFEITTLMAFKYFADENVDIAVIETGLGGRLDSTNIIIPILSVITNIGWDHSDILGDTLQKIALEKAGIIKKNIPVVIGQHQNETDSIFVEKAKNESCIISFADDVYKINDYFITKNNYLQVSIYKNNQPYLPGLKFQLIGFYQIKNIPTILHTIDFLKIQDYKIQEKNIYNAFKHVVDYTQFMGRWQIICNEPITICDIGHNKPALFENINQLLKMKKNKIIFILGFMKDKDIDNILPLFPADDYYIFTQASIPRSLSAIELYNKASKILKNSEYINQPSDALKKALSLAEKDDIIYVGGSTFVVAEIL